MEMGEAAGSPSQGVRSGEEPIELRFKRSNRTVKWHKEMNAISSFLGVLVGKINSPNGPQAELDEQSRVVVDDSSYHEDVVEVLISTLEGRPSTLRSLEVEKLLQCLRCADYFGLPLDHFWELEQALWENIGASVSHLALDFSGIRLHRPLAIQELVFKSMSLSSLELANLAVQTKVRFEDATVSCCSFGAASAELTASRCTFNSVAFKHLTGKIQLEVSKFSHCSWERDVPTFSATNVSFTGTKFPATSSMELESVTFEGCAWDRPAQMLKVKNMTLTNTDLPAVGTVLLESVVARNCVWDKPMQDLTWTSCSLTSVMVCAEISKVTFDNSKVKMVDLTSAGSINFMGSCFLQNCRLRARSQNPRHWTPGFVTATGCIFSGMTFALDDHPLAFVECTFYKCTFLMSGCCRCVTFDKSIFMCCSIQSCNCKSGSGQFVLYSVSTASIHELDFVHNKLKMFFTTDCKVIADTPESQELLPESHQQWLLSHKGP